MATNIDSSSSNGSSNRCFSGGVDRCVQIWEVTKDDIIGKGGFCHGEKINSVRCCKVGEALANPLIVADTTNEISVISVGI